MTESLEFIKCYYRPAFFRMKIDLPVDLSDLSEVTDGTLSLYLHEYIHFIQDISTVYGLMNISTITYYLHDVAHRIGKQKKPHFAIPIQLLNDGRDFGYNNFLLKPFYIGTSINPKRERIEIVNFQIRTVKWGNKQNQVLDVVYIEAKNLVDGQIFEFQLGGNHITEGMAYLCEQTVYAKILEEQGHKIAVDEYPYLIVQKLAENIYPELAQENLLLIAICDASLMTYHPGLSIVRLLKHLKSVNFISSIPSIKDLYVEAHEFLKGNHIDFSVILETVRTDVKKNFKVQEFEGNNLWIDILFDRIKNFRTKMPEFIIDLIRFGDLKQNRIFAIFYKLLGSPLVINGESEGTITLPLNFIQANFHPSLFWAINQVLRIFSNQTPLPCELIEYCRKSQKHDPEIKVDDRCKDAPWSRCNDSHLCPFAVMWKHWSLSNYYPIIE